MSRRPHPDYKNTSDEYEVKTECRNCGDRAYIVAPKGTKAKDAAKGKSCRNCGCDTLKVTK